ncbi:MAG: zinc ribbon domain-containing protein [Clostridia bacterium]|nr:zinc ribbon domain-containing protein [Clostridia bacterium]
MKCPFCSNDIPDNVKFCTECGAPLGNDQEAAAQAQNAAQDAAAQAQNAAQDAAAQAQDAAAQAQEAVQGYADQAQNAAQGYADQAQNAAQGYADQAQNAAQGYAAQAQGYADQAQNAAYNAAPQYQPQQPAYQQPQYQPQQPAYQQPQPQYQPQQPAYQQPQPQYQPQQPAYQQPQQPVKAKKKSHVGMIILVVVLLALIGAGVWAATHWEETKTLFTKTFKSDEEYLKLAVDKTVDEAKEEASDEISTVYSASRTMLAAAAGDKVSAGKIDINKHLDSALTLTLGSALSELIPEGSGVDLGWFRDVGLDIAVDSKGLLTSGKATLKLNGEALADVDFFLDAETGTLGLNVPLINSKAVLIDVNGLKEKLSSAAGSGDVAGTISSSSDKMTGLVLPEYEAVKTLIERYKDVVVENLDSVSKEDKTVKAGSLEQNFTVITVKITEKTVKNVVTAVLSKAKTDKEVKEVLRSVFEYMKTQEEMTAERYKGIYGDSYPYQYNFDFDEWYDGQFGGKIDEAVEKMKDKDYKLGINDIKLRLYTDSKAVIKGFEVETENQTLSAIRTEKGDKFAFEIKTSEDFAANMGGIRFVCEGEKSSSKLNFETSLKQKDRIFFEASFDGAYSGDKLTGKGSLKVTEKEVLTVELTDAKISLEDKVASGKIRIGAGKDLGELFFKKPSEVEYTPTAFSDTEASASGTSVIGSILPSLSIELDLDINETKNDFSVAVNVGKSNLLTLSNKGSLKTASDPAKFEGMSVNDEQQLNSWLGTVNGNLLSDVKDSLTKAGVPEELSDSLINSLSRSIAGGSTETVDDDYDYDWDDDDYDYDWDDDDDPDADETEDADETYEYDFDDYDIDDIDFNEYFEFTNADWEKVLEQVGIADYLVLDEAGNYDLNKVFKDPELYRQFFDNVDYNLLFENYDVDWESTFEFFDYDVNDYLDPDGKLDLNKVFRDLELLTVEP